MQWGDRPSLQQWLWPSVCMRYHVIGLLGQSTKPVKPFSTMDRDWSLTWPCWWWNGWMRPWCRCILWWNCLSYIFFIISVIFSKRKPVHVSPKWHYILSLSQHGQWKAFWPLAKGARLLTGRERRILWMAWLMDTEMEAGTGLLWREEGILVVTIKKPEHTVQSSRFIGGDVFNEKSGFISCSWAGLAKYLGRMSFQHYTRRLG